MFAQGLAARAHDPDDDRRQKNCRDRSEGSHHLRRALHDPARPEPQSQPPTTATTTRSRRTAAITSDAPPKAGVSANTGTTVNGSIAVQITVWRNAGTDSLS